MKCPLSRMLLLISALVAAPCWAQTQATITEAACQQYQRVDKELNQTYRAILAQYAAEPLFLAALQRAQRAWLTFRDLHLEARFLEKDKQRSYGSVYLSCRCAELTALTQARVHQLRRWLEGTEEGDVCSGSIRQRGGK